MIGDFTFETFHEYREAQEDVKKIDLIHRELDIHDPEVAVRLYNMVRDGEIVFRSPIGKQFFEHISDIVADRSVDLLEDKAVVDVADTKAKKNRRIGAAIIAAALAAFIYVGYIEVRDWLDTRRLAALQDQVQAGVSENAGKTLEELLAEREAKNAAADTDGSAAAESEPAAAGDGTENPDGTADATGLVSKWTSSYQDPSLLTVLPEYAKLYAENPDFAGWLSIDETSVNYPVMQTNDNSYYLKKDFDGRDDANGTLFLDYRDDIINPTTNTIIYGHNMKSGKMFGTLDNYLTQDYFDAHRRVRFDTRYEKREYEVVAVCLSRVEYQDEDVYRYYNFIHAGTEEDFLAFYRNIQSLSVYGSEIDLQEDDEILTLSTCNNYVEDGRLFIVARRVA